MPQSLRCLLKRVAVAGDLCPRVRYLKPVLDLRLRHDPVHESLPPTVEGIGTAVLLDAGDAFPFDEQRHVAHPAWRQAKDLVDQIAQLAGSVPFDDQTDTR